MKTLKQLLMMALIVLAFQGCKKDDESPSQASLLIGTWEYKSTVVTNCTDSLDNFNDTCTSSCDVTVITATTIDSDPYTASGNTITSDGDTYTFSISGTTLTITYQESVADGGCKYVTTLTKV